MTTLAERLIELRQRCGLSQRELGERVGISQQAIEKIETGLTRQPRRLVQLAAALNTSTSYLQSGIGPLEEKAIAHPSLALAQTPSWQPDLPVLGRAEGGLDGNLVMESDPIDWTHRPAQLRDIPNAFAVYVTGDSMNPKYRQGDLAFIHPTRPIRRGRYVLVETRDHRGLIKEFIAWRDDTLVVRQYNPAKDLSFPRHDIKSVMLVLGSMDA